MAPAARSSPTPPEQLVKQLGQMLGNDPAARDAAIAGRASRG